MSHSTPAVVEGADAPQPRSTAGLHVRTSESVCEGHPDKVADFIADSILDSYLALDRRSRVACEVLCKSGVVVLAGEISSTQSLDHVSIVREAIRATGYDDPRSPFSAQGVHVLQHVTGQSWEIGRSVDPATNLVGEQGAGDRDEGHRDERAEERQRKDQMPGLRRGRVAEMREDERERGRPQRTPDEHRASRAATGE